MDGVVPDPESELCLACGLCCNSGLFTHVELTGDDRALLAAEGLPAPERIDQPCQFWDRCCTVYDFRPHACRQYRCEVLAKVRAGELPQAEALDRVRTALELRDRFIDVLPDSRKLKEVAQEWRDQPGDARSPAQARAMLDYVVYRLFVERHFLGPKQRWVTPVTDQPS